MIRSCAIASALVAFLASGLCNASGMQDSGQLALAANRVVVGGNVARFAPPVIQPRLGNNPGFVRPRPVPRTGASIGFARPAPTIPPRSSRVAIQPVIQFRDTPTKGVLRAPAPTIGGGKLILPPKAGEVKAAPKISGGNLLLPPKAEKQVASIKQTEHAKLEAKGNAKQSNSGSASTGSSTSGSKVITVRDGLGNLIVIVLDSDGNVISTDVLAGGLNPLLAGLNPYIGQYSGLPPWGTSFLPPMVHRGSNITSSYTRGVYASPSHGSGSPASGYAGAYGETGAGTEETPWWWNNPFYNSGGAGSQISPTSFDSDLWKDIKYSLPDGYWVMWSDGNAFCYYPESGICFQVHDYAGQMSYRACIAPMGATLADLPSNAMKITHDGRMLFVHGPNYFAEQRNEKGEVSYVVVAPPVGSIVPALPGGQVNNIISKEGVYYEQMGVKFRPIQMGGKEVYVITAKAPF